MVSNDMNNFESYMNARNQAASDLNQNGDSVSNIDGVGNQIDSSVQQNAPKSNQAQSFGQNLRSQAAQMNANRDRSEWHSFDRRSARSGLDETIDGQNVNYWRSNSAGRTPRYQ